MADSIKALSVIRSPDISDHWKEKVVPRYAMHIMVSSFLIIFYLMILFFAFGVAYCLSGLIFFSNLYQVIETFCQIEMQIITVVFGMCYVFLRNKIKTSKSSNKIDYTLSSRALHQIVLDNSIVKEMAFDIDCMVTRFRPGPLQTSSPVYIAGLARAGTTILLEALYSTGAFTTLTYRTCLL